VCDPARSFGCCIDLRKDQTGVIEKDSTRPGQFDAARFPRQQSGANLTLEVPDLPAQRGWDVCSFVFAATVRLSASATATKYRRCRSSTSPLMP